MSASTNSQDDLWAAALNTLKEADRQRLAAIRKDHKSVLKDVLSTVNDRKAKCIGKQWTVTVRGKTIVLRDVFEKMATWIQKLVDVGDVAVQYDPGHAALPWAAFRFILQVSISDVETFGMVVQDTEGIANVIVRCSILEDLYSGRRLQVEKQLRHQVTTIYTSILRYLATVLRYLNQNTAFRFVRASLDMGRKLEKRSKAVNETQDAVLRLIHIAEAEKASTLKRDVDQLGQQVDQASQNAAKREVRLLDALHQLDEPIRRIDARLDEIRDQLKEDQRAKILRSISTLPYPRYHKTAAKDRLKDSGQWLLQKSAYKDWRASSTSSVLWLHGIPGSGKTKLTSLVIDDVKDGEHLAFFYCARNSAEPFRAETDHILACLVRQMASTARNQSVLGPVVVKYEEALQGFAEFEDHEWTAEESLEVLLQLLPFYPCITIVIDALDEVNPAERSQLIDALNDLVANAATLVKVFVSSRENYDIVLRLQDSPNVYIHTDENSQDIERFIEERLTRAKLLRGNLSSELSQKVSTSLQERAQGMFRMVDLQLQTLSLLKTAADIESRLTTLPATLHDSYRELYHEIRDSGDHAFALAKMVFQWLLVAKDEVSLSDFASLTPYWPNSKGYNYTPSEINDTCAVLISIDERTFRFSHLSVREYFDDIATTDDEGFKPLNANAAVASACLSYLMDTLGRYRSAKLADRGTTVASSNPNHDVSNHPVVATDSSAAAEPNMQDTGDESTIHLDILENLEDMPGPSKKLNKYAVLNWKLHASQCDGLLSEPPLSKQLRNFMIASDGPPWVYRTCARVGYKQQPYWDTDESTWTNPIWFACDNDILDLLGDLLAMRYPGRLSDTRRQEDTMARDNERTKTETPLWYAISAKKTEMFETILAAFPRGFTFVLSPTAINFIESRLKAGQEEEKGQGEPPRLTSLLRTHNTSEDQPDFRQMACEQAQAIFDGKPEALAVLVRYLAIDDDLLNAVEKNIPNTTRWLLTFGIGRRWLSKALINAYSYGHEETADLLLDFGAEKEKVAVVRALKRQLYTTAIRLIESGYDISGRYLEKRQTALHYAAASGRIDIVQLLLDRGANPRKFDMDGHQPHHLAAKLRHWDIVTLLQQHDAELETPGKQFNDAVSPEPDETALTEIDSKERQLSQSVSTGSDVPTIAGAEVRKPSKKKSYTEILVGVAK